MTNHWKIPGLLSMLTIMAGCWLSKVQKEEVDYPYQALSESEVKQRAGIPDSVELVCVNKG